MTKNSERRRWAGAAAVVVAFAATAAILLRAMPQPHGQSDYLIAGSCAALVALVVLFAVLGGLGTLRPGR